MAGFKINRVTSDIRLCLSELLRDVKDPRVSKMLSIVKLDVTGDMSYATVYVSAIEGKEKTEESVRHIAISCGFIDAAYFTNCFKTIYNISPTKYRNNYIKQKNKEPY